MGNKNEAEKEEDVPTIAKSTKPVDDKPFMDEVMGVLDQLYGETDNSETESSEEENLSFPTFLSLAKDLTSKWPEGTLQAYLLYKYKTQMVLFYFMGIIK